MRHTRRSFLKTSVAGGGFPTIVPSSVFGFDGQTPPNNRVSIGLIGCGSRSKAAYDYRDCPQSEVVAVCDPNREKRLVRAADFGPGCANYNDFRELLARKDIDAVHIATGDHWHVPISLRAARAGKDCYTEKPLGLTIEQCFATREIVDKHHRIFQYGTQNRSLAQLRLGLELVLNGHIGEVKEIYAWCPPGLSGGSPTPELPVPDGFDYDLWLGPAPCAPFCFDRCIAGGARKGIFHIYDYAIGFIAGWGAHPIDQVQWWADTLHLGIPTQYEGTGVVPTQGLYNTVTTFDLTCTYPSGLKLRFVDGQTARQKKSIPNIDELTFDHGSLFLGERGWVAVSRGAWKVFPEKLFKNARNPGQVRLKVSKSHPVNFVESIVAREQPISDLKTAISSDVICHLADICIRTGRPIQWDPAKETIVGDAEAVAMMRRPMREPWTL
ncbi:MAG: Gfo/Idh/MocA family protein [Acidobacteriota bacterium]